MSADGKPGPSGRRPHVMKAEKPERALLKVCIESDDEFSDVKNEQAKYVRMDNESDSVSNVDDIELDGKWKDEISKIEDIPVDKKNKSETVNWVENPSNLKTFAFQLTPGLIQPPPGDKRPIDFFYLLASEDFFEMICTETNAYAKDTKQEKGEGRFVAWKPLTRAELKIFFGLLFHIGAIQCPRVQHDWEFYPLFKLHCFRRYMACDRFLLLKRILKFPGNPQKNGQVPDHRLIGKTVQYFNDKMENIYIPNRQLMLFRQYIRNQQNKIVMRLYMLTDSSNLILNCVVHTEMIDETDELKGSAHAANVVLSLMSNKLNLGYSLYMDDFYNSYILAKQLLDFQTHCTGTLSYKRKHNSQDVEMAKLHVGEAIARYSEGVLIGKWRSIRDVLYISTEHDNMVVETCNKTAWVIPIPKPIAEYNKHMSGVDVQDQNVRWSKNFGLHIIYMMLYNAHVLHNKFSGNKMRFYDFCMSVAEEMLLNKGVEKSSTKKAYTKHFPVRYQRTANGRLPKCKECFSKQIVKDTQYICLACPEAPGLCLEPCFKNFHLK